MSISFLSVFSNVSVCSAHLIILFHPSSDLLTITTSRDRPFSPLVANQTVVHLWRWSILCNFPPMFGTVHDVRKLIPLTNNRQQLCTPSRCHVHVFHRWGIDFIGPLKETTRGKKCILVATEI